MLLRHRRKGRITIHCKLLQLNSVIYLPLIHQCAIRCSTLALTSDRIRFWFRSIKTFDFRILSLLDSCH